MTENRTDQKADTERLRKALKRAIEALVDIDQYQGCYAGFPRAVARLALQDMLKEPQEECHKLWQDQTKEKQE